MKSSQTLELLKMAYDDFEQDPSETTVQVWETALITEDFQKCRAALLHLLASWEKRQPPKPKNIIEARQELAASGQRTTQEQSPEEFHNMLELYAHQNQVPVFARPTEESARASFRFKRLEETYNTGRKILIMGKAIPEYAIKY